jgi:D-alanyl-D-alanine carboxypeptidase (penicillin-binding protein 5/6)
MRYCIMNSKKQEEFLTITRTETYQFQDVEGKRSFSCYNHNAFLNMMDGALSGKTGFTSDAGYCYVGALRRDKRTFIVALLACGWPNNKSYKWSDMRTLMTYALDHYQYKTFEIELPVRQIFINNGIKARSDTIDYPGKNGTKIPLTANLTPVSFLLKEDETISVDYEIPDQLDAPVRKGMQVGRIRCTLNDKLIREYPVYTTQNAEKRTFKKCVEYIFHLFSIQNSYQKAENIKKDQAR